MGCATSQAASVENSGSGQKTSTKQKADNTRLLGRLNNPEYHFHNVAKGGLDRSKMICEKSGHVSETYNLSETKLGEGAFGFVRMASHKTTGSKRAVKNVLKSALTKDNLAFVNEIGVMKAMDHPHIIKLYESFEDDKYFYLVMEVCSGGELVDAIIEAEAGFTEKQAARIEQQMLQAVRYMHLSHIVHRDLKPENFLLQSKCPIEECIMKLIDFGTAGSFTPGVPLTELVGTAMYLAPEVIQKNYGPECDLWACGVILYILLCGHQPYIGEDKAVMKAIVNKNYQMDPKEWDKISDHGKDLVKQLMTKDVSKRITSDGALSHIWVQEQAPCATGASLNEGIVSNLRGFRLHSRLKKASLEAIAGRLSEEKIATLRDLFKSLDTTGDGQLRSETLREALKTADAVQGLNDGDLQNILDGIDADGSGFIDYTEFLAAAIDHRMLLEDSVCWEAFSVFDRDGNGTISMDELQQALNDGTMDESMKELMKEVDANGDGEIDFDEFKQMMRQSLKEARVDADLIANLRRYRQQGSLKKVALQVMAEQLGDACKMSTPDAAKISTLRDTFASMDLDGDRLLSKEELQKGLADSGVEGVNFAELIDGIHHHADGSVDYREFLAAALDQQVYTQKETCERAFKAFDLDGDGKISISDLKKFLDARGSAQDDAEKMLAEADTNGAGEIDFSGFMSMMTSE